RLGGLGSRTARAAGRQSAGRPARRSAVLVAMFLVSALLLRAWWPTGQYQPIGVNERGTVLQGLSTLLDGPRGPSTPSGGSGGGSDPGRGGGGSANSGHGAPGSDVHSGGSAAPLVRAGAGNDPPTP